jgi:AraC-like DNA-binding protein
MKLAFEKIEPDSGSSFKVIHWKSENDRFFWHQHPEFEIIFVKKGFGKLHVGNHLGQYHEGEIMFLGPNLPHAGLGYGVRGQHEEIIVQLPNNFLGSDFLEKPELASFKKLFEKAALGISFYGRTRLLAAKNMERLAETSGLNRLLKLLETLNILAQSEEYTLLNSPEVRLGVRHVDEERINKIYGFVETNFQKEILLEEVSEIANLTVPSFCRYFKKMTQMTFTDFLNEFRINNACKLLQQGQPISDVCFMSGFNNISHFNKTFKRFKGKSPREYRKDVLFMPSLN